MVEDFQGRCIDKRSQCPQRASQPSQTDTQLVRALGIVSLQHHFSVTNNLLCRCRENGRKGLRASLLTGKMWRACLLRFRIDPLLADRRLVAALRLAALPDPELV